MNHVSRRRAIALPCLLSFALLTACGDSDGDRADQTTPAAEPVTTDATAADTAASTDMTDVDDVTDVDDMDDVDDTVSEATDTSTGVLADDTVSDGFADAITSVEGDWVMMRRTTDNRDYWVFDEGVERAVEGLLYRLDCDDADCSTITMDLDLLNEELDQEFSVDVDGTGLSGSVVEMVECFNPDTEEYDGPLETELTRTLSLEASPVAGTDVPLFHGVYNYDESTPQSEDCEEETYGYDAEVWLFDPSTSPAVALPEGVFAGEGNQPLEERGFRACTADDGAECAMVLRTPSLSLTADGSYRSYSRDTVLTGSPSEGYTGTDRELGGCASDTDGSFVTEEGYTVTSELMVHVFDIGQPVVLITEDRSGEPLAELTAEQAAVCGPFEHSSNFAGLLTETWALVDWTDTAAPAL